MLDGCTVRNKRRGYYWARGHHNSPAKWLARIGWNAIRGGAVVEKPLQEGFAVSIGHYETHDHGPGPTLPLSTLFAPAAL